MFFWQETIVLETYNHKNNRLEWILLVEPNSELPDLEWLDAQFDACIDLDTRRQLLDAKAPGDQACGAVICSCYQVRELEILAAIEQGADSALALGEQLKCGTNCGSCVPELKALLKTHRVEKSA